MSRPKDTDHNGETKSWKTFSRDRMRETRTRHITRTRSIIKRFGGSSFPTPCSITVSLCRPLFVTTSRGSFFGPHQANPHKYHTAPAESYISSHTRQSRRAANGRPFKDQSAPQVSGRRTASTIAGLILSLILPVGQTSFGYHPKTGGRYLLASNRLHRFPRNDVFSASLPSASKSDLKRGRCCLQTLALSLLFLSHFFRKHASSPSSTKTHPPNKRPSS